MAHCRHVALLFVIAFTLPTNQAKETYQANTNYYADYTGQSPNNAFAHAIGTRQDAFNDFTPTDAVNLALISVSPNVQKITTS